jgi:transcriptional regulator with XRE-family HTH domain
MGWTLDFVAKRVGVSAAQISRVEDGKVGASPELADRLATFFGKTMSREQILYPEDYTETGASKPARRARQLQAAS